MIFRFDIRLRDIEPPIWRMIEIPARASFWHLHVAIQDAMGWLDYHLHQFSLAQSGAASPLQIGMPDDDFGDDWRHDVELVGIEPRIKGTRYPRCLAGERACPPEDCGGPSGYFELMHALADPGHPEHKELGEWVWGYQRAGKPFNPETFNPAGVKFSSAARRLKALLDEY